MEDRETERLLNFCCELCRQLMCNGAEIYRVEESANRLLAAYGCEETEVFAIPSCVIIKVQGAEHSHTKAIRIRTSSNNLDKLDRLNALCRELCRERPSTEEAARRLQAIVSQPDYTQTVSFLAYGCVAAFFTLFWGGTIADAVVAFPCGLLVKITVENMTRVNANTFFTNVCASAFLAVAPVALAYLGYGIQTDKIIIGSIMLLVPGIAITNVMRDVLAGDFLTALSKFAEVIIVAVAIAIGIAIPVSVARMLWGVM